MSSKGNPIKLPNGMTPKQNQFTKVIVEQISTTGTPNATQAAMEVYDVKDRATANAIGAENLAKPIIAQEIQKALASNGLSIEKSLEAVSRIVEAKDYKLSGETVLKASIEVLKLHGVYPGQKQTSHETNINIFTGLSYDEAKKKHEAMTSQTSEFVEEAEIV